MLKFQAFYLFKLIFLLLLVFIATGQTLAELATASVLNKVEVLALISKGRSDDNAVITTLIGSLIYNTFWLSEVGGTGPHDSRHIHHGI